MNETLLVQIERAFANVTPPEPGTRRLTDDECRAAVDDLLVYQPEDLHWILPQLMLFFLRAGKSEDGGDLELGDVISDLDVRRASWTVESRNEADYVYYTYARDHVRTSRDRAYVDFTSEQCIAILAFLTAVKEWSHFAKESWLDAIEYWSNRSRLSDTKRE